MKHAILIVTHKNVSHLCRLLNYFDNNFCIFIHWDKQSRLTEQDRTRILEYPNVVKIIQKYKINWASVNFLKAELLLLEEAMNYDRFTYFHLFSGQDYPTKALPYFKKFFSLNNGSEFINYRPLPRPDWENNTWDRFCYYIPCEYFNWKSKKGNHRINSIISFQKKYNIKRKVPKQFNTLYGGENWFSLTYESVNFILEYTKQNPSFLKRLKYTFAADESYIQSILLNSDIKDRIINNNLRYIKWEYRNGNFPANLDISDFYWIIQSDVFFARKFEYPVAIELIRILDKTVLYQ